MMWIDLALAVLGPNAPLFLGFPAFMPGFRKFKVVAGGNAGKPMGLLLILTYAS